MLIVGNFVEPVDRPAYLFSTAALQVHLVLATFVFLAAGLLLWPNSANFSLTYVFACAGFCGAFQIREYVRIRHLSRQRYSSAVWNSGQYCAIATTMLVLAEIARESIFSSTTVLWILSIAALIPCFGSYHMFLGVNLSNISSAHKLAFLAHRRYSQWELVGSISNYAYIGLIPLLIAAQGELTQAGGFAAAKLLLGPLQVVGFGVYNLMVSRASSLAHEYSEQSTRSVTRITLTIFFIFLVALIPVFIMPDSLLAFTFGLGFAPFGGALRVFGVYYLVLCLTAGMHAFVLSRQQPQIKGASQAVGMITCFAFIFPHFQNLTAYSGAMGSLIGETTTLIAAVLLSLPLFSNRRRPVG